MNGEQPVTGVSTTGSRIRWTALGVLLGAVSVATAFWLSAGDAHVDADAGLSSDPAAMGMGASSEPSASDMSGMQMGTQTGMQMDESPVVRLSPGQIQQFGVTFAMVEEVPLESRVRTVGVVEVDETRLVEVAAKFPGYVERLYADFTGKVVTAGDALLDVYAPDLVAAQEELLLAGELQESLGAVSLPGVTTAPIDLEATARRRLMLWDITDDQIDSLMARGEPSRTLSLRAPITGTVLDKQVVAGAAFSAGQMLFRLADLSTVWVSVEIRESDATLVGIGSPAIATLTSYPGEGFAGVVDFVYPTVDARTRSIRARIALPNPGGRLRPGMFATVVVTTPRRLALSVPMDAVVRTGEATLLFVVGGEGGIRPVEIVLGRQVGDRAVVLSGVEGGETVVSAAQYLIDAEANIGATMRSMMSMMGSGDMAGMDMDSGGMEGMDMNMPVDTLGPGG
jgi:Cu(I)/Ag(I) efflux system membrane fusion protein